MLPSGPTTGELLVLVSVPSGKLQSGWNSVGPLTEALPVWAASWPYIGHCGDDAMPRDDGTVDRDRHTTAEIRTVLREPLVSGHLTPTLPHHRERNDCDKLAAHLQ